MMDEEVDKIFCEQLGEVISWPLDPVLMRGFNLQDTYRKLKRAEMRQSMKFLEYMENNFLTQLVKAYQEMKSC